MRARGTLSDIPGIALPGARFDRNGPAIAAAPPPAVPVAAAPALPRLGLMPTLMLAAIFIVPVLMGEVGLSSPAKLVYPALFALAALVAAIRSPGTYLSLIVWSLVVTPGIRHVIDFHAGYSDSNPIMLAPYLGIVVASPFTVMFVLRGTRFGGVMLTLILAVCFGLGTALVTGAFMDPLMAAMRWLSPICFAGYVCAHAEHEQAMRTAIVRTMAVALPAAALYAIIQFVSIMPWDAYFMTASKMGSIGWPEPFLVRVFGTMNSPGSLAALLGTGTLFLLPRTRGLGWLTVLLAFGALFLTTQRAAMGAFVVALVYLIVTNRDPAMRANIIKLVIALALTITVTLSIPGAGKKLLGSFSSVSQLDKDDSAQQRLEQYNTFPRWLDELPLGRGLAWSTNGHYLEAGDHIAIDSGIIDILVSLGVPAGLFYLGALGILAFNGMSIVGRSQDSSARAEFAGALFGLSQLPFGGQQTAEHGILLYLMIGLFLVRAISSPSLPATVERAPNKPLDRLAAGRR
ncbi:O-Antigen ligase [Arboricoccus pini]|uniref:O-Antigen ligase n=1 Tax=Arboricoccus pini TaxID=1963835 RepID=A0A212RS76_9PROT|nr:O-antigen ligase family protein [Arboricoccus pini]SNB75470.1 O-Antigen ligase [Arboricoccus pini]